MMAWLVVLIRTYFVLVLAISGLAKLRAPMAFEQTLAKQGVIPARSWHPARLHGRRRARHVRSLRDP
jgi:uncharacterized membrane protein YphA (DoxX/SURF4 family)